MSFKLLKKSSDTSARTGVLKTAHGVIHTPFFMPIATKGSVKGVEVREVADLGAEIVLANTYHLYLQPGLAVIKKFKGLHRFMNTSLPILTDSGGFQVFSLSKLRKVDDNGVTFRSPSDGSEHRLTPEESMRIQMTLGSDIMMAFDYFPGYPATVKQTEHAIALTTVWAQRCYAFKKKNTAANKQMLFGIVQGSTHKKLREESVKGLLNIEKDFSAKGGPASRSGLRTLRVRTTGWDGFAVGGLAVGDVQSPRLHSAAFARGQTAVSDGRWLS